ncbi:hypothetical protein [Saccharopolyspora hattusasensis]|uniref:hypothetical protein n=1 Tax=Saccharopolyspora hattusasensis TaxID=1128679 RepID=UPI003D97CC3B
MYVQYAAEGPSSPENLSEPADGRLGKVNASGYAASKGADGIRRQALSSAAWTPGSDSCRSNAFGLRNPDGTYDADPGHGMRQSVDRYRELA